MASAACHGAVDRLSDLCDDLLLHVLGFLPDARHVVRTSALSARWRRLWTRVPVLRLVRSTGDARFNDFVHRVLARRVAHVDTLELRALLWPGISRADLWLRRAMRHAVASLEFQVCGPRRRRKAEPEEPRPRLSLPSSTRVTKMSLELDYAVLLLPPTVEFRALTDLTLRGVLFSAGDDLGRVLSSCPRLRKVTLSDVAGLEELRLDGAALEALHLKRLRVRRLRVDAPRLSALHVGDNFMLDPRGDYSVAVRAPALEKLEAELSLSLLHLQFQRHTVHLLQQCRPSRHVLRLHITDRQTKQEEDKAMAEIPQLHGITDMTVEFCSGDSHYMGATQMSSLLARCSNLEYLRLDNPLKFDPRHKKGCSSCSRRGSWRDGVISLEHLREVKLGGFSWKEDCCIDMVQLLLASAPALERMTVTANACPTLVPAESPESSLPRGRGRWTSRRASNDGAAMWDYEWTPDPEMLVMREAGDRLTLQEKSSPPCTPAFAVCPKARNTAKSYFAVSHPQNTRQRSATRQNTRKTHGKQISTATST